MREQADEKLTYQHTDEDVEAFMVTLTSFIWGGSKDNRPPRRLEGALVYGAIQVLRVNDEKFYGDDAHLTYEQQIRLREVDHKIEKAVQRGMQFYPIGHNGRYDIEYGSAGDKDDRQRAMSGGISRQFNH